MRILVVDDDSLAGEMIGAVLEGMGHEAILSEDGVDAADKLNSESDIELIISDMNMPMVSGLDLFRELREQGNTLPFILLTGDAPDGLRLDGLLQFHEGLGRQHHICAGRTLRDERRVFEHGQLTFRGRGRKRKPQALSDDNGVLRTVFRQQ